MKQRARLLFVFLFFPALWACQATTPLDYLPALKGDYFKYPSAAVGRPFHIYVAYPEDYGKDANARYPVVYRGPHEQLPRRNDLAVRTRRTLSSRR